ncbi:MAG: hypothetical protein OXF41_15785 [bacterium]|nr:hypothetical protein [bacterium]
MRERRVILVTQGGDDAAIELLAEWARYGLVDPFVSCVGDQPAVYVDSRGRGEPSSVFEILAPQDLEVVRVVALCGPANDATKPMARVGDRNHVEESSCPDAGPESETVARVRDMVDRLRELAPDGLRVLEARMWVAPSPNAGREAGGWEGPEDFFDPAADANLVVIPEDRQTEAKLAIPLTDPHSDRFASHVATELATGLGMWSGMYEAPVDGMTGGVIGFGEAKVHLVRSFVRIAEIPAVTLAGAADHGGVLRVPSGAQEAPYPRETIIDAQRRIESLFHARLVKEPAVDQREPVGMREFLRVMGRGARDALRYMFTFSQDVIDALRDMTGRMMQETVGHDSVLRVIWRGMPPDSEDDAGDVDAEALMESVRRQRALEGGVLIDQQLWADVGKAVFSSADGGKMPDGVDPLRIKDQVMIVKEVRMIAPDYGPTLADELRADAARAVPTTLLGRLAACLHRIEEQSRRRFDSLVERSKHVLEVERLPAVTPAGAMIGALATLAVTGLLVLTGIVELIGVTEMSPAVRGWLWGGATVTYGLVLAVLTRSVAARLRDRFPEPSPMSTSTSRDVEAPEENESEQRGSVDSKVDGSPAAGRDAPGSTGLAALPGFGAAASFMVLVGLSGGIVAGTSGLRALDATAFGVSVALAAYAIALALRLDRKPYRSLETFRQVRMLFFFTVIYGALGLVGLLARENGWYGDRRQQGFGDLWIGEAVLMFIILLLLAAMAVNSFRREKKARIRISDLEREVMAAVDTQWAAEEAFEQFIGSATAWAAVIWKPFGEFEADEAPGRDRTEFDVMKAEARPFLVTPLGAMAMRERMMKELAKRGWLGRRYEAAVEAYRRRRAIETGEDPAAVLRPDRDPREVHTVAPEMRRQVSGRWRFMHDLLVGTYDRDLSRALAMSDYAHAAEWAFRREGTLEASEIGGDPLDRYLGTIVTHSGSEVSYIYFDHEARPEAERMLETQLWWPSKLIDPPDGRSALVSNVSRLANGDLAIMSVRHDKAGPYVAADVFGKQGREMTITAVVEPVEPLEETDL